MCEAQRSITAVSWPVPRCERKGGLSPGNGGSCSFGQPPAAPAKEQSVIQCLCIPTEGIAAELAEGGGMPGPLLHCGHSSPFLCAAGNLRFLRSQHCSPLNRYQMWVPCASH